MRKNVFGRQFKRDANERKALFKNLLSELVMHERIHTTVQKAKAVKSDADKLVTVVKKNSANSKHAQKLLLGKVHASAMQKLLGEIGPRFADRPGGYTRVIKLGRRFGDDAMMAYLEWSEVAVKEEKKPVKADGGKPRTKVKEAEAPVVEKKQTKSAAKKQEAKPAKKTAKKETK